MHGYSFWIGLLVPFGIIYIMNWVIFILIFASLLRRANANKETSNNGDIKKLKEKFRIALGLSILFGIAWAIGLLASSNVPPEVHYPAEWIFTLLNVFLAVCLFILHVLRSPEARELWKKWLCCHHKKTVDLSHSSTRRNWLPTLRSLAETVNLTSAHIYSNPSEEMSHIDLSHAESTSTAGLTSPTLPPTEIELHQFDPDEQSNNEEASQTISASKLPVNLDVETESNVETMFKDDDASLLSFYASSAQINASLSHADAADCYVVENKNTEGSPSIRL